MRNEFYLHCSHRFGRKKEKEFIADKMTKVNDKLKNVKVICCCGTDEVLSVKCKTFRSENNDVHAVTILVVNK